MRSSLADMYTAEQGKGLEAAPVDLQLVNKKVRTQADTCYVYPSSQDIEEVQSHAYCCNSPTWGRNV